MKVYVLTRGVTVEGVFKTLSAARNATAPLNGGPALIKPTAWRSARKFATPNRVFTSRKIYGVNEEFTIDEMDLAA